MATELEITSYRNILDILDDFKSKLVNVNLLSKIPLAASTYFYSPTPGATSRGIYGPIPEIHATADSSLVGFGITKVGNLGHKIEWYEAVRRKVLENIEPPTFLALAFKKSTGAVDKLTTLNFRGGDMQYIRRINNVAENYTQSVNLPERINNWVHGQMSTMSFLLNDLVRLSSSLQYELTRVRVPMPEKFSQWLEDIRNTALSANMLSSQGKLYIFRIWELSSLSGELVTDLNTIKSTIDNQIKIIETAIATQAAKEAATVVIPVKPVYIEPIPVKEVYTAPTKTDIPEIIEKPVVVEPLPPGTPSTIIDGKVIEEAKKLPAWVIPAVIGLLTLAG